MSFWGHTQSQGATPSLDRRMQSNLAALFVTPSPKKTDGNCDQAVNDQPFINERKPSSTMAVKGVLNNGEHTLIPVTAMMIHSAIWDCKQFVLKDGGPLHMIKLVGAVRNFCVNKKTCTNWFGRWHRICAGHSLAKTKQMYSTASFDWWM
jgi:hypothetical protein